MSVEIARKRRAKRASALAALASGTPPLREVLMDGHKGLGTCPIWRVVLSTPGMGPQGARRVLERAGVWPLLPLDELSELQRQAIIDELPRRIR